MSKQIHIVMSYYNRKAQLLKTLETIKSLNKFKNLNVIIVDDCSNLDNRLEDIVSNYNFNIKLLRVEPEKKNWYNPCITYNYGFIHLEAADDDVVIIQNPECTYNGDILNHSLITTTHSNYLVYNCASLNKEQTNSYINNSTFEPAKTADPASDPNSYDGEVTWYTHSKFRPKHFHFCSSITYKNLKKLNGFDVRFQSGHGFDDDEFSLRVSRLGLNRQFISKPFVYHLWHERIKLANFTKLYKNRDLYTHILNNTTSYTANNNTFFGKKIK